MASITGSSVSFKPQPLLHSSLANKNCSPKSSVSFWKTSAPRVPRLRISCNAKPETVEKVSKIVREQLQIPKETAITGETKFLELGADSLDTVEIVMKLEEEFSVSVEEENAQGILSIQDAAELIEKLTCE